MLQASLNCLGLLSCQNYVRQMCGEQFLGVALQRFSVDTIFPLKDTSESTLFSVFWVPCQRRAVFSYCMLSWSCPAA